VRQVRPRKAAKAVPKRTAFLLRTFRASRIAGPAGRAGDCQSSFGIVNDGGPKPPVRSVPGIALRKYVS